MPEPQIFKATYSGVPVYEMMVKTVAVMRRRADGWLNATQILKVAGFDKPQRTRILEREVQKGEHEKVQGGYGKYQGTWVPAERGVSLARQYNCDTSIRPIVDFIPHDRSPPPAPKHVTAAPVKAPRKDLAAPTNITTRSSGRKVAPRDTVSPFHGSEDGSLTSTPSGSSASSRTPSPIISSSVLPIFDTGEDGLLRRRKAPGDSPGQDAKRDPRGFSNQILEYFVSDTTQIPKFLVNPPPDYDPNVPIDDDTHTALHWASAMGRIKVVKYLLTAGADVFRVNKSGQTALMRSVMFANNYDVRKFTELYELLHRSTLNIDNNNRTVFHHIVDVAISKGKVHAARYYMETILNRLSDYPHELADIINFQDEEGETALTLAARCRSKRLVKLLIDHGADPKITNRDGKSAEDYILEDERYRFSPPLPHRNALAIRNGHHGFATYNATPLWQSHDRASLHHSIIAQRASTKVASEISVLLNNLAESFDYELLEKERDTNQAHSLLNNIEAEVIESHRTILSLQAQASAAEEAKATLRRMEETLVNRMSARHKLGFAKWTSDDMEIDSEADTTPALDAAADCAAIRKEIEVMQTTARENFESFVKQQAEAGTGGKMTEYKKLIAAGCGTLSPADVDSVIDILLETMETEENLPIVSWSDVSK